MSKVHFHKPRGPQGQNGKWEHKLWTGGLSQETLSPLHKCETHQLEAMGELSQSVFRLSGDYT